MRTGIKIALVIIVFIVGMLLFLLAKEAATYGNPIGYFIIFPAMFAAWRAIWKYNPDANSDNLSKMQKEGDDDKHILRKD